MGKFIFVLAALTAAAGATALAACNDSTPATASSDRLVTGDGGGGDHALDAAIPDSGDLDAGPSFGGLVFDGEPCTVTSETLSSGAMSWPEWPVYQLTVDAVCRRHGQLELFLYSRADLDVYPHECGIATELSVYVVGSYYDSYQANASLGSCDVTAGPTEYAPNTHVALEGTVSNGFDVHHVRYAYAGVGPGHPIGVGDAGSYDGGGGYESDAGAFDASAADAGF